MSLDLSWFRLAYVADGGSSRAADSYCTYLRRADRLIGGVEEALAGGDPFDAISRLESLPDAAYGGTRNRRDSLSAARKYVDLRRGRKSVSEDDGSPLRPSRVAAPDAAADAEDMEGLVADIRSLAIRYYKARGRPLGVTGEMAELAAAACLEVELAPAREAHVDGWMVTNGVRRSVQIKGRAVDRRHRYAGRCPAFRAHSVFDLALLVLLDRETMEPLEIWELSHAEVFRKLVHPGSKARNERGSLGISQFCSATRSGASAAVRRWSA